MKTIEKVVALSLLLCGLSALYLNPALAQPQSTKGRLAETNLEKEKKLRTALPLRASYSRLLDSSVALSREFLDKNIQVCSMSIQRNPNYVEGYMVRGLSYWRLEDSAHASSDLEKAFSLAPNLATPEMLRILAECFAEENKNEKAIKALTTAINMGNPTGLLYLRRAQAYSQAKNYEAAFKDAQKVVALNPHQRWALELRGHLGMSAGKYALAARDFTECIKLSPEEGKLYANRANAYDALGKKSEALADRKKRDSLNSVLGY